MVFRKRGKINYHEKWVYNEQNIEVVDNFNYLGTVINYNGSFTLNQEHLAGKAIRALSMLLYKCKAYDLKPKLLCQLFDAFVVPILNYASEICGFTKSKELERIHLKFCKRLLQVRSNTCNAAIYGELGRYPLYIGRYVRIIKYWFKIQNTENKILNSVYNQDVIACNIGHTNWVSKVKKLLSSYGFAYAFNNPGAVNMKTLINDFKNRCIDEFKQE